MKYITLDGKFWRIFEYHVAILNAICHNEPINFPTFIFNDLEKLINEVKLVERKLPLHKGLIKMVVGFMLTKEHNKKGGGTPRKSGLPITRNQLLLSTEKKGNDLVSGKKLLIEEVQDSEDEKDNIPLSLKEGKFPFWAKKNRP